MKPQLGSALRRTKGNDKTNGCSALVTLDPKVRIGSITQNQPSGYIFETDTGMVLRRGGSSGETRSRVMHKNMQAIALPPCLNLNRSSLRTRCNTMFDSIFDERLDR